MRRSKSHGRGAERGQVVVIAAGAMLALIGMVALVLDLGNAYAQQRASQNAADSAANAGAEVLAERFKNPAKSDLDVANAVQRMSDANGLASHNAEYTDVSGQLLGVPVGGGAIPANAQGVHVEGTRTFGTFFARALGFSTFNASADATAVTGPLIGGPLLNVIFPVNIVDCEVNGDLGVGEENWHLSDPGTPPNGQEYIVPLCKTGGGSFMVLDLDNNNKTDCLDELNNPPPVYWPDFPVQVPSNQGNDCAKKIMDWVNDHQGQVVTVPICDAQCITSKGANAEYTVIKVAGFYIDYMSDSNNKNNSLCQAHDGLVTIAGNGSDSCIAGWFVSYQSQGPVGTSSIDTQDTAIGIQLIK